MPGPGGPGGPGGGPRGGPGGRPGGRPGGPPPPPPRRGWGWGWGGPRMGCCLPGCLTMILGAGGLVALIVMGLIALF